MAQAMRDTPRGLGDMAVPPDGADKGADTKTRLINAAEELFAKHGLEGVSTRQITNFAGQRNESAVHYHFGGRQGLVQAIVDRRSKSIDGLRHRYLDRLGEEGRGNDLRGYCECIAYPQLELMRTAGGGRYFVRFIDEVLRSRSVQGLEAIWRRNGRGLQRCLQGMRAALAGVDEELFIIRFTLTVNAIIAGLAAIEQNTEAARAQGADYDPGAEVENLLDMCAAGFLAPVSAQTRRAWAQGAQRGAAVAQWPPEWIRPEAGVA